MMSQNDADTANVFHVEHAIDGKIYAWRRNGKTARWKKDAERFRIPIKYGLYNYEAITQHVIKYYHKVADCTAMK